MRQKYFFPLLVIFAATLLIYAPSLNYYFFQDDWYILNQLNSHNLLYFFKPPIDIIYYRPLGMQSFFYFGRLLFGLNPIGYHLIIFSFHFINVTLLFFILRKTIKSFKSAFAAAFIYATASLNFMALSWIALSWNVIGSFFILFVTLTYLWDTKTKNQIREIIIYVLYLLGLLSTEFAIILPFFLILYAYFFLNKNIKKIIASDKKIIIAMLLTDLLYLLVRFFIRPLPAVGEYQLQINFDLAKNLLWYILWAFNMPEEIKYQIIVTKLRLTPTVIKDAGPLLMPTLLASFMSLITFLLLIFKSKIQTKALVGGILIFITFLSPVIFLPHHTYPYYLTLPFIGLVLVLSNFFARLQKSTTGIILVTIFLCVWFFSSLLSISLNRQLHWVNKEQGLSREAIKAIQKEAPAFVASGSKFELITPNTILNPSLSDQNALRVLFNNQTIKTIYTLDSSVKVKESDYQINFQ